MFQLVAVPGIGEDPSPEALLAEVDAWTHSEPLLRLVSHWGGSLPHGELPAQLAYLDEFAASTWNFRRGERNQVDPDAVTGADEELVVAASEALGLVRPRPPKFKYYDHVLVLGGLVRANLWRTAYAAHLLDHGITAGNVAAICGYRDLARNDHDPSLDEYNLLRQFGLPRRDFEWEVMEDCLRRAFGLPEFVIERESAPSASGGDRFRVAASSAASGKQVSLVVAPAAEPGGRANTADGYHYWAGQVEQVRPGERILAVTTCIYVPYQHAVALQGLAAPFGCSVDTVGIDFSAIGDDPSPQRFRGAHYLLEIRSALLAYRSLVTLLSKR